jgi:hypothetical protein
MLAHALVLHLLGRDWRVSGQAGALAAKHVFHQPILKLFDDKFANHCPFSGASLHPIPPRGGGRGCAGAVS